MNLTQYIIECVQSSADDHECLVNDFHTTCKFVIEDRFLPEYGWYLEQRGIKQEKSYMLMHKKTTVRGLVDYLTGLPFDFDYMYCDILNVCYNLKLLPKYIKDLKEGDPIRENLEDNIISIWFELLARCILVGYRDVDIKTVSATLLQGDLYYENVMHKIECKDLEFKVGDRVTYKPYEQEHGSTVKSIAFCESSQSWVYTLNNGQNVTKPTSIKESKYFCDFS